MRKTGFGRDLFHFSIRRLPTCMIHTELFLLITLFAFEDSDASRLLRELFLPTLSQFGPCFRSFMVENLTHTVFYTLNLSQLIFLLRFSDKTRLYGALKVDCLLWDKSKIALFIFVVLDLLQMCWQRRRRVWVCGTRTARTPLED